MVLLARGVRVVDFGLPQVAGVERLTAVSGEHRPQQVLVGRRLDEPVTTGFTYDGKRNSLAGQHSGRGTRAEKNSARIA
jgi:hypothetical protein